eukprot:scaffold62286_cov33-Phaeocystis_antarctica.AAC.1
MGTNVPGLGGRQSRFGARLSASGPAPLFAAISPLLTSLLVSPTARRRDNVDALVAAQAVRSGACGWGLHARAAAHLRACHGHAMHTPGSWSCHAHTPHLLVVVTPCMCHAYAMHMYLLVVVVPDHLCSDINVLAAP